MADGRERKPVAGWPSATPPPTRRETNWRKVVLGLAIAGVAGIVSLGSYSNAGDGGSYVVLYGAVIVGAWIALQGFTTRVPAAPPAGEAPPPAEDEG